MITPIISIVLLFIICGCIFKNKLDETDAQLKSGLIILVGTIISIVVVTEIKKPSLDTYLAQRYVSESEGFVTKVDTGYYVNDTTKNGTKVIITQQKYTKYRDIPNGKSYFTKLKKTTVPVLPAKNNGLTIKIDGEVETYYPNTEIMIGKSDGLVSYWVEYKSNLWVSDISLAPKGKFYRLVLKQSTLDTINKEKPNLLSKWKIVKA